jgi:hypothetical protein
MPGMFLHGTGSCISLQVISGRDVRPMQFQGKLRKRPLAEWRVTWPGVGWRSALSEARVVVTTQDLVGLRWRSRGADSRAPGRAALLSGLLHYAKDGLQDLSHQ